MPEKDRKRDPTPPPDSTPKEIGEFWDTHSLSDYWGETHEVDFQANLKLEHNMVPVEREIAEQIHTHNETECSYSKKGVEKQYA